MKNNTKKSAVFTLKKALLKSLACSVLFLSFAGCVGKKRADAGKALRSLPVQSGGRVQPFDTFARDSLRFVCGKSQFNKKPAVDVLMSWILLPEYWNKTRFIQVRSAVLKKSLKLDLSKSLFSPQELLQNKVFIQELAELKSRQESKTPLDEYFKSLQKLENRLSVYQAVQRGFLPGWAPADSSKNNTSWRALSELKKDLQKLFQQIIKAYVSFVSAQEFGRRQNELSKGGSFKPLLQNHKISNRDTIKNKKKELKTAIIRFQKKLKSEYPEYGAHSFKISLELIYNSVKPFRLAWIFYLLGFVFLFLFFLFRQNLWIFKLFYKQSKQKKELLKQSRLFPITLAWMLAFCLQGAGLFLRSMIMGRPPVTNMYETVIWVPWIAVVFGAFLWWRHKAFFAFVCSCFVALFCLLLADSAPELLDGRLQPLEAVLRSNFWLMTHVLIITMSYSAFFLAFAIGDVLLFIFLKSKNQKTRVQTYVKCIDRSLQAGVVLLALGTILGGIWADYSWGRFWGWDPKETWALISLLGYLALLHGRLLGWIKEFGLAVGAVLMFFLIVMAWYGVNYVLGQGLHSYGFGSGGVEYVAGFALAHLVYVFIVWSLQAKKIT